LLRALYAKESVVQKVITILLLSLILCACSITKPNNNVEGASAENLKLEHYNDVYTLHLKHKTSDGADFFGAYIYYYALTGGTQIHLFPDKNFVITDYCDICPEVAVGSGTYTLKNSKIHFNYKVVPTDVIPTLNLRWGWIQKDGYVTGNLQVLLTDAQLKSLEKKLDISNYVYQLTHYPQWRRIKDKFIKAGL